MDRLMSFGGGGGRRPEDSHEALERPSAHGPEPRLHALPGQILNNPTDYYSGSTVAPQSGQTQAGLAGITQTALQPGLNPSAQGSPSAP
jgi:hypothetical protein